MKKKQLILALLLVCGWGLPACGDDGGDGDADGDVDTDTDSDADRDSDAETVSPSDHITLSGNMIFDQDGETMGARGPEIAGDGLNDIGTLDTIDGLFANTTNPGSIGPAEDAQVPMPPSGGWPSFPRAVTRVEIPRACGTSLHNVWCKQDSNLEKGLEQEFWLLLGNLGVSTDPSVDGLNNWLRRVESYIGYKSRLTGLATPHYRYGGFRGGPTQNRARLTMLLGAANIALFRAYDIEVLVDAVQNVNLLQLVQNASHLPALKHLLEALKYSDEAAHLIPEHQNALGFAFGLGAFAQWALPLEGIDLGDVVPNVRGTLGLHSSYPLGFDGGKNTLLKLFDPTMPCYDEASCRELGGTEGLIAGAFTLMLLDVTAVPTSAWSDLEHHDSFAEAGLSLNYDPVAGDFGTYASVHTSSIAPFKKLGGLLVTLSTYAQLGKVEQMRALLVQARELARQQQWPFMERIDDLEARIEGTGLYAGNSLLTQWQRGGKRLGYLQLPLNPATGVSSCSSCHFAAEMPNPDIYDFD